MYPHASWRGGFIIGTTDAGQVAAGSYSGPPVQWPAAATTVDGQIGNPSNIPSWMGSLLTSGADGSGLEYRRNRYYDPQTGRFTQQDPAGLGGGMNLYGFASGDPVNFSDPFGLCPPKDGNVQDCGSVQYWRDRAHNSPTVIGKIGNSMLAGLAAIGEDAKAEALGEVDGGCGTQFACGVVPDFGPGAKSAAEFAEHIGKYERALDKMEELKSDLARAKGPRARKPILEQIDELSADIKGHIKEIRQKWKGWEP